MDIYQLLKDQLNPPFHSWDTVNFIVPRPDWPHSFFPKTFWSTFQLLFFVNLYQHAKNEAVSSICSGEIVDLKILQSDWLRAFMNKSFPKYEICTGTQQIKVNNQVISTNSKTLLLARFWSISPILGAKKYFPENLAVTHNWVSSNMPKFRKINYTSPRKRPDRQKDRPYFIRPLQQLLGIQKGNTKCMLSKFPMYLRGELTKNCCNNFLLMT